MNILASYRSGGQCRHACYLVRLNLSAIVQCFYLKIKQSAAEIIQRTGSAVNVVQRRLALYNSCCSTLYNKLVMTISIITKISWCLSLSCVI
jgi:hypothetical protein